MKKIKYLLLSLILSGTFACTDLEEQVYSQLSPGNFYNTIGDAEASVIAIYNSLNRPVALWDFGMLSLTFMPAPHTQSRVPWREAWANYTTSAGEGVSLPRVWDAWYRAIFRANISIVELEKRQFDNADDDQRRIELIAEGKWLRAWSYFNLVRLFGEVPMPLEATETIEGAQLPGTSIDNLYAQIIADLEANDRGKVVGMIAAGGFVESLFIATQLVDKFDAENPMIKRIASQKLVYENIMAYLEKYKDDQNVEWTITDMKALESVFADISDNRKDTKFSESKSGKKVLGGTGGVYIMEQEFEELRHQASFLRNSLTFNPPVPQ